MSQQTDQSKTLKSYNLKYQLILLYRIALLMVLFSISRIAFFFYNIDHFADMTLPRFMTILFGGLKFDISGIMFINVLYAFLYLLPIPHRTKKPYQKALKYLFLISNSIALAANVGDIFYFDFILKRSTADVFMFAGEGNILKLFSIFFVDYFMGVVFWVILVILLVFGYNRIKPNHVEGKKPVSFYVSGVAWLLITIYFSIIGMRGGFTGTTRPISLGNAGVFTEKPLEMAIVLNTPFCIIRTLDKQPLQEKHYFTEEELDNVYTPVHTYQPDSTKEFKPMNVVVLIMESFAKEYIGAYNRHLDNDTYKGYTPFLDSLIGESKCFQYSFANGRMSIEAMPSVISGIPSILNPYVTSVYASNRINGLAGLLKQKGYTTAFFHGAPNGSMGFDSFAKLSGHEKYFGMTEYGNSNDFNGSWGIWDEEFFQFMADKLNELEKPFQATLFSLSSHHPFNVPERYENSFDKGTLEIHAPIQYSDMSLRKFFEKISKAPWFKNTLFVITADHSNHAWHDEYKTSIGNFSIPILFYQPNDKNLRGMDSTFVAQQTDIMPTILNYLNYDRDYIAFGNNLLDDKTPKFAFNYSNNTHQFIRDEYVLHFRDDKEVGFYNYRKDPLLQNNIVGQMPELEKSMLRQLKGIIQQYNSRMIKDNLTIENQNKKL